MIATHIDLASGNRLALQEFHSDGVRAKFIDLSAAAHTSVICPLSYVRPINELYEAGTINLGFQSAATKPIDIRKYPAPYIAEARARGLLP